MDVEASESDSSTSYSMTASSSTIDFKDGSMSAVLWHVFDYLFMYYIIHSSIGIYYPLFHCVTLMDCSLKISTS
jgi:hypothetical protein